MRKRIVISVCVCAGLAAVAVLFQNGCARSREGEPRSSGVHSGAQSTDVTAYEASGSEEPLQERAVIAGRPRPGPPKHQQAGEAAVPGGESSLAGDWEDGDLTDEIWIIERPPQAPRPPSGERYPTQGELRAVPPGERTEVPLPLKHTDVRAQVSAFIASVRVTQQYENPYDRKIEAVYVFPLPETAAVTDFVMTIGDRHIRGMIREREEAQRIYQQAKREGYVASLLTQERPNIFTQKVANIEPGKQIDVEITYFNPLRYDDGAYEFVFPMVVGPRFNPPGSTKGIGAVGMGNQGVSGQKVEVQYLPPHKRNGHDISVAVEIDAAMPIETVTSHSHVIDVEHHSPSRVTASIRPDDTVPNKDFVLRYKLAGKKVKAALLTHRSETSEQSNVFALVLQPPAGLADIPRIPREMVFVLDCSGSMSGWPLAKAKEAMRRCLRNLDQDDTFQIIRFSENASSLGRTPIPATPDNIRRGLTYLDRLQSEGGTMMIEGIKAALDFPRDAERSRIVSFMTDGYIGNEAEILAAIHQRLGSTRIFSFGVGQSVNRYLLESMARLGRGAVAYVGLEESSTVAVDLFYERASRPALTDIRIDWGGMTVDSVYPRRIPDLFVGRPVVLTGLFGGQGKTQIRVRGRAGREECEYTIPLNLDAVSAEHNAIASVWARWKIADLSDREIRSPSAGLRREMTRISLDYKLLCQYTAFLAVDTLRRTTGDHGVSVNVPVPVPAGVRYDTTVNE